MVYNIWLSYFLIWASILNVERVIFKSYLPLGRVSFFANLVPGYHTCQHTVCLTKEAPRHLIGGGGGGEAPIANYYN